MEHVIYGAVIALILVLLIIEKRKPKCHCQSESHHNCGNGDCFGCGCCQIEEIPSDEEPVAGYETVLDEAVWIVKNHLAIVTESERIKAKKLFNEERNRYEQLLKQNPYNVEYIYRLTFLKKLINL